MKILKKYFILIICLFISAIYFNTFQFPNKIVTGGLAGLSIVFNYWFNIEPSKIIFFISITTLIIGYLLLGKIKASGAIISTIIYPFFIKATSNLLIFRISNLLIVSIIIGVLSGITTSIVYRLGFSNGGLSIISELLTKYSKLSLGFSSFLVNVLIVLLGGFSIGIKKIFYSLIILFIHSQIIDKFVRNN